MDCPIQRGARMRRAAALAFAGAALATVRPSLADEPVHTLPAIEVFDSLSLTLTNPAPAQAAEALRRTPGGVAVVEPDQFASPAPKTLKDVLDFTPGVLAQARWGEDSRLSIRGSGIARNFHLRGVQLLQDGVPYNMVDGQGDFQQLDPLAYQYAEVYKGANALEYGAASLGGALNFVMPTGYSAEPYLLRGEVGSFGFRRLRAQAAGVSGDLDYVITPTLLLSDGFRDHSEQDSRRLAGNLGYRIADNVETRFYLNLSDIDQETVSALTKAQALADPEQAGPTNAPFGSAHDITAQRLANRTVIALDDAEIALGAYAYHWTLFHPIPGFQLLDQDSLAGGAFARAEGAGDALGLEGTWTVGLNLATSTADDRRYVPAPGGTRGALVADLDQHATNATLYGEYALALLPDLRLIAGAQGTLAGRSTDDRIVSDGDQSDSKWFRSVNPKLGVLWDAAPEAQLFANLSRSFEPPDLIDLPRFVFPLFDFQGYNPVKAQRAITAEVGTRGTAGRISWDVSLYRAWLRNELQCTNTSGVFGVNQCTVRNLPETIHQGIELGLAVDLLRGIATSLEGETDRLTLRQAYTLSDFSFDGDASYGDNTIPGIPKHYLRAELRYTHPDGFYGGPNLEWVPAAYFVDNANTLKTEAYALLGFTLGYDAGAGLSVFLEGRNLTDETYIALTDVIPGPANNPSIFYPGDGRAVYFGVSYAW
ncbi:MAG: TonB-dependent receptor family protein [Alphaproteobacteria bacterium]